MFLVFIGVLSLGIPKVYAYSEDELTHEENLIEPQWFVYEPRIAASNNAYNTASYDPVYPYYYGGGVGAEALNDEKFKIVVTSNGTQTRLKPHNLGLTLSEINSSNNPVPIFNSSVSIQVTRLYNTPYTNAPKIYFANDSQQFKNINLIKNHISSSYQDTTIGNGKVLYRYGNSETAIHNANWQFKSVSLDTDLSLNLLNHSFVNERLYQIIILYEIKEEKPNWLEFWKSDYYYQVIGQYYFGMMN